VAARVPQRQAGVLCSITAAEALPQLHVHVAQHVLGDTAVDPHTRLSGHQVMRRAQRLEGVRWLCARRLEVGLDVSCSC
jgi:hypothetical protein